MKVNVQAPTNASLLKIIISALISVVVSLVLIVIFALLIKWCGWEDSVILPINIVIKITSAVANIALIFGINVIFYALSKFAM